MNNAEFKEKLKWSFAYHPLMCGRNYHTVNELLYVLGHDTQFSGQEFNISVAKLDNGWCSIPGVDVFVDVHTRGVWFNDDLVEFEIDKLEFNGIVMNVNCITVHEINSN